MLEEGVGLLGTVELAHPQPSRGGVHYPAATTCFQAGMWAYESFPRHLLKNQIQTTHMSRETWM